MIEFHDDDASYLAWITTNRDGFVLNVRRNRDPTYVILHRARCFSISTLNEPQAHTQREAMARSARSEWWSFSKPQDERGDLTALFPSDAPCADHDLLDREAMAWFGKEMCLEPT